MREAGAGPILYLIWTTKEDGESAQNAMNNAYLTLQRETGCEVAHVGENWRKYHREHPDTELYAEDPFYPGLCAKNRRSYRMPSSTPAGSSPRHSSNAERISIWRTCETCAYIKRT